MNSKQPLHIFLVICVCFFPMEFSAHLISKNYYLCHFIFGFGAPYLFGYFPANLFRWNGFLKLPANAAYRWSWSWSVRSAVIILFIFSFVNEVIDDPIQNGIPFFHAWQHFAIDLAGTAVFIVFYFLFFRNIERST